MSNEHQQLPVTQASSGGCCGSRAQAEPQQTTIAADDMATCPVMAGSAVVKSVAEAQGLFRDYKGQRYWFCCAGCGPLFDADPEKYTAAA
ncbi:YHS domain-containing protein [Cellulomonas sp. ACRRI]|uniref:YHS domain-containing protein n=1 Tax=Cellulomonas sp. ACRRI TaxID=2918188 RepID=UPI001EF1C90A|nr:YHS domain-containing protein [Cellulomonas sp. ACRRI]MCG7284755.1 YHS domain-containing protein [Cellulomonas sp. ACRRI]